MSMDSLKSHIHFSDTLSVDSNRDKMRKNFYSDTLAHIISESLFLFNDDYYTADIEAVQCDMTNIEYCIDLYPTVNASVDIYHNWIILYLFMIVAANNMTILTESLSIKRFSGSKGR